MILGQRIRLDPNNVQWTFFERCAGTARFAWNWGLARWREHYEAGEKPTRLRLQTELNTVKSSKFPWMTELPWAITTVALMDLGTAFTNFFRRVKEKASKPGYPKFKKKGRCREGFAIEGRALQFDSRRIKVPKLGWIRTRQDLRFPGKVLSARFSKHAGHWYVSVQVEVDESWVYPHRCKTQAVVGVDLGVVRLAVPSEGEPTDAPRALRFYERRLQRLNKELDRRKKTRGANWKKTLLKLQKCYERIDDVRKDVTHKLTAQLVRDFRWIGIENLHVTGMMKNRHIAKSIADAAMAEVSRQLAYKSILSGSTVVVADRWFPSTKTCSNCSVVNALVILGVDHWICPNCGMYHDRDVNAAINLKNLAAAHAAIAQRQGSAGDPIARVVKLPSGWESSSLAVN